MPFSRERTCGIVQLVRFRFRRIAGKDRVIPQLASRDQRAARRVVDRAGDASRVRPQLPTCTYFPYRLCVTEGVHFFVCRYFVTNFGCAGSGATPRVAC